MSEILTSADVHARLEELCDVDGTGKTRKARDVYDTMEALRSALADANRDINALRNERAALLTLAEQRGAAYNIEQAIAEELRAKLAEAENPNFVNCDGLHADGKLPNTPHRPIGINRLYPCPACEAFSRPAPPAPAATEEVRGRSVIALENQLHGASRALLGSPAHIGLWDAIHAYCAQRNLVARENAVVDVEIAVRMYAARLLSALSPAPPAQAKGEEPRPCALGHEWVRRGEGSAGNRCVCLRCGEQRP